MIVDTQSGVASLFHASVGITSGGQRKLNIEKQYPGIFEKGAGDRAAQEILHVEQLRHLRYPHHVA